MRALTAIGFAATAMVVYAGEDSTDRWGSVGTGPAYWETACGLTGFVAEVDVKPCAVKIGQLPEGTFAQPNAGSIDEPAKATGSAGEPRAVTGGTSDSEKAR